MYVKGCGVGAGFLTNRIFVAPETPPPPFSWKRVGWPYPRIYLQLTAGDCGAVGPCFAVAKTTEPATARRRDTCEAHEFDRELRSRLSAALHAPSTPPPTPMAARRTSYFEFVTKTRGAKEQDAKAEELPVVKTLRSGFPCHPSCMAYDPVQRLLAMGTRSGSLCVYGQPGVERFCEHESEAGVLQLHFLVNEGALVSVCSDDKLHMWSLRQHTPVLVHSLTLEPKASITSSHLPFRSKWLYVGTAKGNVHVVAVESFAQSQYSIMWNDAAGPSHPGDVIHISENPLDEDKLLVGYETGLIVLWDIKSRKPHYRYDCGQDLHSMAWQSNGEQAVCGLEDGTVGTWSLRNPRKLGCLTMPHDAEWSGPIMKVDHRSCASGESVVVFTGSSAETSGAQRSIFIVCGSNVHTTDMDSDIVDFVMLSNSPYAGDLQNPFAVAVLLEEELLMIDLEKESCPLMESPASLRLHQSDVTSCLYCCPCSPDFLAALCGASGTKARQRSVSRRWPLRGGKPSLEKPDSVEVILTGHSDGTLKIWDGSGGTLALLTEVDAGAVFEREDSTLSDTGGGGGGGDGGLAIRHVCLCRRSHVACVALACAHVLLYALRDREVHGAIGVVDVGRPSRNDSPDVPASDPAPPRPSSPLCGQATSRGDFNEGPSSELNSPRLCRGALRQAAGYQLEAVVRVVGAGSAASVSSVALCSEHNLVAIGHNFGVTVVDFKQKSVLASFSMSVVLGGTDAPMNTNTNRESFVESTDGSLEEDHSKSSPVYSPRRLSVMMEKVMKGRRKSASADQGSPKAEGPVAAEGPPSSEATADREPLAVSRLCFGEPNGTARPGLVWAATSRGTVASLALKSPRGDRRSSQPAVFGQNRKVKTLGGPVLCLALLDHDSRLLEPGGSSWQGPARAFTVQHRSCSTGSFAEFAGAAAAEAVGAPSGAGLVLACAERQARVWGAKASYKRSLCDAGAPVAIRASAVDVDGETRLACLHVDGNVAVFQLPALAQLFCVSLLPALGLRAARTACFANGGHVLYMGGPGEMRRAALVGAEQGAIDAEYRGDLFISVPHPEPTNNQFFKKLFKSWGFSLDKRELFGDTIPSHPAPSRPSPGSQLQRPLCSDGGSRNTARDLGPGPGSSPLIRGDTSSFDRLFKGIAERGDVLQDAVITTTEMESSAGKLLQLSEKLMRECQGRRFSHK
ncbi:syntaxin-binding protein 5-like isoform X2 [Petromyzon marinus]|uniref:syntaxin-binding protein 5-like isoform X2 n=1 Tax=Petromyzon marinus TaxID=7757 RepID=UPI003F7280D1